ILSLGTTWLIYASLPKITGETLGGAPFNAQWHLSIVYKTPFWFLAAFVIVALAIAVVMGLCVNINKFSLHAAYRDRLIRAYLGASRSSEERQANPFTGLDENDNLQMNELLTDLFYADQFTEAQINSFIQRLNKEPDEANKPISEFLKK